MDLGGEAKVGGVGFSECFKLQWVRLSDVLLVVLPRFDAQMAVAKVQRSNETVLNAGLEIPSFVTEVCS